MRTRAVLNSFRFRNDPYNYSLSVRVLSLSLSLSLYTDKSRETFIATAIIGHIILSRVDESFGGDKLENLSRRRKRQPKPRIASIAPGTALTSLW